MTKGKLLTYLRKLNKHYQRRVKFRTGYPWNKKNTPCADIGLQTLFFPPEPIFYDRHILAHEYAHVIDCDNGVPNFDALHDSEFEAIYREVCLVVGVFPIPTEQLRQRILKAASIAGLSEVGGWKLCHVGWCNQQTGEIIGTPLA